MMAGFNNKTGLFELIHNGKTVDTARDMGEVLEKIELYERLVLKKKNVTIIRLQDTGKNHIHYIRMLADEIFRRENIEGRHKSWIDCLKIALRLHIAKMREISISSRSLTQQKNLIPLRKNEAM